MQAGMVWRVGVNTDTGARPWMFGYPVCVEMRDGVQRIDLPLNQAAKLATFLTVPDTPPLWTMCDFDSRQGRCVVSWELRGDVPSVRIQSLYGIRDIATAWLTERSATGLAAAIKDSIRCLS